MNISKALELEAKIADILKKEVPNLYITLKCELNGDVTLIIRECPRLTDIKLS